jgi:hypothetical protein
MLEDTAHVLSVGSITVADESSRYRSGLCYSAENVFIVKKANPSLSLNGQAL